MEVLYSLDLTSERGVDLVLLANKLKRASVQRVTTRAEAKKAALVESEEALVVQPSARPIGAVLSSNVASSSAGSSKVTSSQKSKPIEAVVSSNVASSKAGSSKMASSQTSGPQSIETVGSSSKGSELVSLDVCRGKGDLAADRPVSDPEPGACETTTGSEVKSKVCLDLVEAESAVVLEDVLDSSDECRDGNVQYELRARGREEEEFVIPPVLTGNASRAALVEETKSDRLGGNWQRGEFKVLCGMRTCYIRLPQPILLRQFTSWCCPPHSEPRSWT